MLELRELSKTYPNGVRALNDVSFTVGKGLFGLLGPNGAGKSSLMRTIAMLQKPDSGTIRFDGEDVLADPRRLRRQLGYLPQDFGVYPRIAAEELLDHLGVLKGIDDGRRRRDQVEALLHLTNLHQVRKRAVGTFSGGMRQRFGIAQALLGDPKLIIVDEPTAGLDPEERNRFHNLLSEIGQEVVIILSTHIVADVTELCPRMAVLAGGRIVTEGRPAELIASLTGKVWRKTVRRGEVDLVRASHHVISTHLFGGDTQVRIFAEERPDPTFHGVPPDLEDVYFALLSRREDPRAVA